MTYPDNPSKLISLGFFKEKGRSADSQRQRLSAIGNQWFRQCQSERIPQERQWYLNIAFFRGNQYVQFKNVAGTSPFELYTPKAPYYRARIVINQVRRIVRKEIARLTAQKPNAFIIPASSEDADVFAAQAGEQIWDSLWRRLEFNKVLRDAIFWQALCGNGFIKTYWDPEKVDPDQDPDKGIYGDICIDSVTPFHLFVPDLMCTNIEDQPYVIHAQSKSNSWVKQNLGVDITSTKLDSVEEGLQNVLNVNKVGKKDQTIILEVWVKPKYLPELPDGGMFTIAGDQIVQGVPYWPYDHGQYPITKIDGMPSGTFYNGSVVEDVIPLQRELNRSRSQLIESKNRMSKPQLTAVEGSIDAKKITTEPGLVIFHKLGFDPPTAIPLQNLPSYVTDEINRLYTDMADLTGQHEVSNGSTPPGVTAATAISFLQEQDESLIATHYTSVEEAIEKIAGQTLNYVKSYWDESRLVKTVGIDETFDVQTFKGADLRSNTDIRVESGSALPTSRAAKQAFIMDLMKMGFIPPEKGLEIMEVGGLNKIYEQIQIDKRQAQRENLKMRVITDEDMMMHQQEFAQNHPEAMVDADSKMLQLEVPPLVPVNTWDEHQIHIQVHNNYRKSQNFEAASPTTKNIFEEHVRSHMEALANMMVHPLTGLDSSNPNAPSPEEEADIMDQQDSSGGSTGPVPMPSLEGEGSTGGM